MQRDEMKNENKIIQFVRTAQATLIDVGLYINWSTWLGLTVMFTCFTVFAFNFPDSFEKASAGIGFLGVTLSLLVMFFYIGDKIRDQEKSNEIEGRVKHIEKMAEKWDFIYDENFH